MDLYKYIYILNLIVSCLCLSLSQHCIVSCRYLCVSNCPGRRFKYFSDGVFYVTFLIAFWDEPIRDVLLTTSYSVSQADVCIYESSVTIWNRPIKMFIQFNIQHYHLTRKDLNMNQ